MQKKLIFPYFDFLKATGFLKISISMIAQQVEHLTYKVKGREFEASHGLVISGTLY